MKTRTIIINVTARDIREAHLQMNYGNSRHCPVARAFQRALKNKLVGITHLDWWVDSVKMGKLPEEVTYFIQAFDRKETGLKPQKFKVQVPEEAVLRRLVD